MGQKWFTQLKILKTIKLGERGGERGAGVISVGKKILKAEILLWNEHLLIKGTNAVKSMFDCNEFNLAEVNGIICKLQDSAKTSSWCRRYYQFVVV